MEPQAPRKQIPEGWIELGGVARPKTDVQLQQPKPSSKLDELRWPHGYSKPLDPDTNPQVRGVLEALKDRTKPSRFSSFAEADPFDPESFKSNPQAYVTTIEPSRVFSPAQPGEGVAVLTPVGNRYHRLVQGESVKLQVAAPKGNPVTFTSFDLGTFSESQLTSQTVLADENGIATTEFTASGGTWHETRILAAGPMTSGQVHFIVDVSLPAGAEEAFFVDAYQPQSESRLSAVGPSNSSKESSLGPSSRGLVSNSATKQTTELVNRIQV